MACKSEIIDDCRIIWSVFGRHRHDFAVTPYHVTDMRLHHALLLSLLLFIVAGFFMVWRCALPAVRRACERAWAPFFTAFCTSFFVSLCPFFRALTWLMLSWPYRSEMVYRLWMLIQKTRSLG